MTKAKKYAQAGVDIAAGDAASKIAAGFAQTTFAGRKGRIGKPVKLSGGFAGALDFGGFLITACDDTVGTKISVAEATGKFETLGYDLLAMVADDAVCLGAEVVAVSNTIECPRVQPQKIKALLKGLARACREQKIVIPGGEIAEIGKSINEYAWGAHATGILEKKKLIDGSKIRAGDLVIALRENGLRCNGFTLARAILRKKFGATWHRKRFGKKTWGELLLTPSKVYHAAILALVGRFGEKRKVNVKGIVHVTGGGILGNLPRIFRQKSLGARLDNLWPIPSFAAELIKLGKVSTKEAREVWNLGNGMLIIVTPKDTAKTLQVLKKNKVAARIAGEITSTGKIEFS
ncbi:MAG: AIR synthase-related protein [Patescibacteria group bacterium]